MLWQHTGVDIHLALDAADCAAGTELGCRMSFSEAGLELLQSNLQNNSATPGSWVGCRYGEDLPITRRRYEEV